MKLKGISSARGILNTSTDIQIAIEYPNELRGLYILIKLIAHPGFKAVRDACVEFDNIPGIGKFCIDNINDNPVKEIYNAMTGGHGIKPTKSRLDAIVRACKHAIKMYNEFLQSFYDSGLVTQSKIKLPSSFIKNTVDGKSTYTKAEFLDDHDISASRRYLDLNPVERTTAADTYLNYADLLANFGSNDIDRGVPALRKIRAFKKLSDAIACDSYLDDETVEARGIVTEFYRADKWQISPSSFSHLTTTTLVLFIAFLKTLIDPYLEKNQSSESIVDNIYPITNGYCMMLYSRRASQFWQDRLDSHMSRALKDITADIPAYAELLDNKGYPYTKRTDVLELESNDVNEAGDNTSLLRRPNAINMV